LYRHDEKVKKVVVWPEPKGKFYPLNLLDPEARYLRNFAWYADARPTSPEDIFRVYKNKSTGDKKKQKVMEKPFSEKVLPSKATKTREKKPSSKQRNPRASRN